MSECVYPNGLPHPPPSLRVRFAAEIGLLTVAAAVFLGLAPKTWQNNGTYIGLALAMFGFIGFTKTEARERVWGPPDAADFDRVRRCTFYMSMLTIPPLFVFLVFGALGRHFQVSWLAQGAPPMFSLDFFAALVLYLPWALLQQTLFQFYLLGRLRGILPFASPLFLSILNGLAYGLVHFRGDWASVPVTLATIVGGIFWSYSYYRDRYVLPIAISHALLGTTFYYWVYGHDLLAAFGKFLNAHS